MNTMERKMHMSSERLTWKQIQEKYPDQWIGITDVEYEEDNNSICSVLYIHKNKDELTEMQVDTQGKILARYTTPDNVFQLGSVGYFG